MLSTKDDRKQTIAVRKGERIHVITGDLLGVYFELSNHGGIIYDKCSVQFIPRGMAGEYLLKGETPSPVGPWEIKSLNKYHYSAIIASINLELHYHFLLCMQG